MSYEHYRSALDLATNLDDGLPMSEAEIERYGDLVPEGLKEVWRRHGASLLFGDGRVQLCDPSAMRAELAPWFKGDREFDIRQFVPYAYTSLGDIFLTDNTLRSIGISLSVSHFSIGIFNPPPSGETHPDFFLAHVLTVSAAHLDGLDPEDDLHADAVAENGSIGLGEVFSWDPPFQITTEDMNARLRPFPALERFAYLRDLAPLQLHRVFKDRAEAAQYGGETFVRLIGTSR